MVKSLSIVPTVEPGPYTPEAFRGDLKFAPVGPASEIPVAHGLNMNYRRKDGLVPFLLFRQNTRGVHSSGRRAGVYFTQNRRNRSHVCGFEVDRQVHLHVNQTARVDLRMEIGRITENVRVVASAPVLAQDTSDVGQVINGRQIVELPLNGRNYMQLASLTNGLLVSNTTESGGPNLLSEGGRLQSNSFLIDGVESRIQREGGYGLNLSVDAIEEFKV